MTTHADRILNSLERFPRNWYDMIRHIGLLIPDGDILASSVQRCLDSMEFSPPETHPLYVERFLEELDDEYPEEVVLSGPRWLAAVLVLVSFGRKEVRGELLERLV